MPHNALVRVRIRAVGRSVSPHPVAAEKKKKPKEKNNPCFDDGSCPAARVKLSRGERHGFRKTRDEPNHAKKTARRIKKYPPHINGVGRQNRQVDRPNNVRRRPRWRPRRWMPPRSAHTIRNHNRAHKQEKSAKRRKDAEDKKIKRVNIAPAPFVCQRGHGGKRRGLEDELAVFTE